MNYYEMRLRRLCDYVSRTFQGESWGADVVDFVITKVQQLTEEKERAWRRVAEVSAERDQARCDPCGKLREELHFARRDLDAMTAERDRFAVELARRVGK